MGAPGQGKRRIALVTGASSGFGLLSSVELARAGFDVIATMRDPERGGDRLRQAAESAGVLERLRISRLDVTEPARIAAVVAETIRAYGRIDVLLNNAGYAQGGFVEDVPVERMREQFETNVWGAIALTKAVIPHMRERRSGTILNMSSVSGRIGLPGFAPYAASKYALEGFSESLRLEMRPFGVYVVLLEPASFRTDIWSKGFAMMSGTRASAYGAALERVKAAAERAARRGGDPADVAKRVAAIANARRPRLRYPLPGRTGVWLALKEALPWPLYEAAVCWLLGRR